LHHICANWINNNDIHQGLEAISGDKNIHLSSGVMREKVEELILNMCYTLQNNSCDNIAKCIKGYYMVTPTWALKQMGI